MNHSNTTIEPLLENSIENSWNDGDYIRCYNLVRFWLSQFPDNEMINLYNKKISKIDIQKEYFKYLNFVYWRSKLILAYEILIILFFVSFLLDYFSDVYWNAELIIIILFLLIVRSFGIILIKYFETKLYINSIRKKF